MSREVIDRGKEHVVKLAKIEGFVLKTPTLVNQAVFWLLRLDPKIVIQEYQEAAIESPDILIPESRFFFFPNKVKPSLKIEEFKNPQKVFRRILKQWRWMINQGKGYIVYQRYIENDSPTEDIADLLKTSQNTVSLDRFNKSPQNFRIYQGSVYNLDPTKSYSLYGILDRKGIIPKKHSLGIHRRVTNLFKNN